MVVYTFTSVIGHRHLAQILAWVLEKRGVFTLMPTEHRTRVPCPGTKGERCLTFAAWPGKIQGIPTVL